MISVYYYYIIPVCISSIANQLSVVGGEYQLSYLSIRSLSFKEFLVHENWLS